MNLEQKPETLEAVHTHTRDNLYKNEGILSKNQTIILKGIMAICIVLHHLIVHYNSSFYFLKPFKYIGFICVGLFFFISGYGLTVSMYTKKDYFKKFENRLNKVIIPFIIAIIIYTLYNIILFYNTGYKCDQNIFFIVQNCWYVYEIIMLYILFFILYKNVNFKKATIILSIILLFTLIIMYRNNISNTWYKSTSAFIAGIIIAKYKKNIKEWIATKWLMKLTVLSLFLLISLLLGKFMQLGILEIFIYNCSVILATIVLLIILARIGDFKNKVMEYLGTISYEIYLYHGLFIDLFLKLNISDKIGTILIITFTIIFAFVINKINEKLLNIITNKVKI